MTAEKVYSILSAIAQINGDEECLLLNPLDDDFFTCKQQETEIVAEKSKANIVSLNNSKPVSFSFLDSFGGKPELRDFSTWKAFEMEVCRKVVEKYGVKKFREFVLDPTNKYLHTKKKNQFGETTELMVAKILLFPDSSIGIYMNTNNDSGTTQKICKMLVAAFPEAAYSLNYVKE